MGCRFAGEVLVALRSGIGGKTTTRYLLRKDTNGNVRPDIPANSCIGIANAPCDFGHRGFMSGRPGWVTSVSVVACTQPTTSTPSDPGSVRGRGRRFGTIGSPWEIGGFGSR